MKRDYKNYFLGRRYKSAGYRLTGALFIFLYTFLIPAGRMHFHPTLWEAFGMKVEVVLFESILLFLFPVMLWGKRWQRILALLLSVFPLVILFMGLMLLLGLTD